MNTRKHPIRRQWMRVGFWLFVGLVGWLPLGVAQVLGTLLGYVGYALLSRDRRLTLEHLRDALGPAASPATRHEVARGVFVNLGRTVAEWCVLRRLSPGAIRRLIRVEGLAHLERAFEKGRGVIVLSGHFGNWELLAMAVTALGFRGGVWARPLRYPEYEGFLRRMRRRHGIKTYVRGSLQEAIRALKHNTIVGVVPDQDVDSLEGVFVDFFGHPTYTPVGPAALAQVTGAPIVPCFVLRDGRRFRVVIEEPILAGGHPDRKLDLLRMTQAWSRTVEASIRRSPDHWVWMHRRWKTQPPEPAGLSPGSPARRVEEAIPVGAG